MSIIWHLIIRKFKCKLIIKIASDSDLSHVKKTYFKEFIVAYNYCHVLKSTKLQHLMIHYVTIVPSALILYQRNFFLLQYVYLNFFTTSFICNYKTVKTTWKMFTSNVLASIYNKSYQMYAKI